MTDENGPGPAQPAVGEAQRPSKPTAARPPDQRRRRRWVPITASWLALLIGLADIIVGTEFSIFYRHVKHPLHRLAAVAPGTLSNLTHTADIIIGLLLLMLSHGLRRRKRRAWQASVVLLASSLVIHYIHGHHLRAMIITGVLLAALVFFWREFYAVGEPGSRWRALAVFVGLVCADIAIGLSYLAVRRGLAGNYTIGQRIQSVIYRMVGATGPVQFTAEGRDDFFGFLAAALAAFTLIVTAYMFLRSARQPDRMTARDASRIRDLLERHGEQDSLGYFALRDDKDIIWSPSGKSCIGYRVLAGAILASGDPIGDPEAWPGAIHAFLDEAARHAWVPAVVGCGELGAEIWCREGGLTALELGDEAVVEVADFSLQGRSMRNVRQMVSRVARQGYSTEIRCVADIPPEEIRRLIRQADSWRGSPTERGFSMALGRVGGPGDDCCVLVTVTENGVLRGLLQFVPWGADGLSLDLMRRDRSAQPGINDFMIVETIKAAPELGIKRISLNFAAFRAALERGERIGAGPVLRAWRRILLFASRWFQIESLYKFNAKFRPVWQPRFLVFPAAGDLPRISLAALEAEAFLVWPTIELRRIARRLGLGRLRRRLSGRRREAAGRSRADAAGSRADATRTSGS
ncbi:MAG: phosphatidylglycerol lysyltransferase domain-containing protein [Streptosporangiaceae bacterium]